jgi:hypothetical protein
MKPLVALLLGGAGAAFAATVLGAKRAARVEKETKEAVDSGGTFRAKLTTYWPYSATKSERKMEGGTTDRMDKPLCTLEQHRSDPSRFPFVSVSGDKAIFPYGQRLEIDVFPGVVFRVVDTGGHFTGSTKVYRALGAEPLDICVDSPRSKVPADATVKIVQGDHFDKKTRQIDAGRLKGQEVKLAGLEVLGCRV